MRTTSAVLTFALSIGIAGCSGAAVGSSDPRPVLPDTLRYHEVAELDSAPVMMDVERVARRLSRNHPPLLRDAGISGWVSLSVYVDRRGRVDSVQVRDASHEEYARAARRVAEAFRFSPALVAGTPVPVRVDVPVAMEVEAPPCRPGIRC